MSKKFTGVLTAIITPFTADGSAVDYDALGQIIEEQIAAGVHGLVPCGTTGESPTVSHAENKEIVRFVVKQVAGRVPVVAGTGSNSLAEAMDMTKDAHENGADGALIVCPYYNKPTQEGIYRHYEALNSIGIPVIVYNIQGRTGVNITTDTLVRMAQLPNIVAVKEASGNIAQMMEVIQRTPDDFTVLCGDDSLTFSLSCLGGDGVISVASHLVPRQIVQMLELIKENKIEEARAIHYKNLQIFNDIFIETNPVPVKTAMSMMGKCQEVFRLPLCEMRPENRQKLQQLLSDYQLLKS